ncbi:ribosomal RNA-processing protein 7 [Medicago truncatula]|uniref:ribosomal RNA-processing protein 7 n=1 Tax=Medicago truncatula TaxID=3880 RepID=UPI001968489B|nr:ribosomal RNA-processing protein 7-like [Medicago truncatula]
MSHGTNIKENKTTQYRPIPPSCFTSHIVLPSKKEKQKKPLLQKEDGRWFGTTRGSVAQAAAKNKLAKKKHTGVHQDFYRFQEREAQRNELMELQSKFEEDKKRLRQLRAARKFRPY